ncbi:MAG: hypothetical protein ACE5GS_06520 [Kiloniellaceae bacterium]
MDFGVWGYGSIVGIAAGLVGLLVTLSTFFYLGINTVLLWKLAVEGAETRRELTVPLLPVFFQNFGIPMAVLGLTLSLTELALMGALMIAFGALLTSDRSVSLHPAVEAPLLALAATALASAGLFHGLM